MALTVFDDAEADADVEADVELDEDDDGCDAVTFVSTLPSAWCGCLDVR